jgi:hypothetical protein
MLLITIEARSAARCRVMNERSVGQQTQAARGPARSERRGRRWHWQTALAALLALLAVEGQPVAASHATTGPSGRVAELARHQVAARVDTSAQTAHGAAAGVRQAADERPDFRVAFAPLDDAQAGQPFSYTIQVKNDGGAATVASVSAVVPPELTNVRVNAPGFVCTRRFTPSGAQAGTMVTCMRNDLEAGAVAGVTIEANAPTAAGSYHLTAVADPRDDVLETDEGNNAADVTVQVRS